MIELKDFITRLKEEVHWSKIQDGTGAWSPGQVVRIIEKVEKEFKDSQSKKKENKK